MIKTMRNALFLTAALGGLSSPMLSAAEVEQARLDAVAKEMQGRIDAGKLAGAVTMVAKDGKVQMLQAYGYQDLENKVEMKTDTIFRIFSMTKPVVGTALMILHDQGKFKLSDPVEKYIPEFKDAKVYQSLNEDGTMETVAANHAMTIQELVSHTGGLTYMPPLSGGPVPSAYIKAKILDRNTPLDKMIPTLAGIPLNHQPGTQWVYSVSVDVQGYLIEVLSGQTLDVFLQEKIFEPLGMVDTSFYVTEEKAKRFSRKYLAKDGKLIDTSDGSFLNKPKFFSGGGGLTSTANDYMQFTQMHLNKGELNGKRIISEEAIDIMRSNLLPENISNIGAFYPGNVFGVDFAVVDDADKANTPVGTHWWWGIAGTWFWIDPVENIVFIGMIQNDDYFYSMQLHTKIRQLMYKPL